ncbi:MAG: hypothetical protein GX455_02345 [Phycisphaerae bacterium]|nr:hypothetical protein [Phycisphaerae bacterium]
MRRIKVRDGILGQIAVFVLLFINKIHLEPTAHNEILPKLLWSIRLFNMYILQPIDWIGKLGMETTQSYMGGFLGFILGILIVGFIYGIIIGAIIRSIIKLLRGHRGTVNDQIKS